MDFSPICESVRNHECTCYLKGAQGVFTIQYIFVFLRPFFITFHTFVTSLLGQRVYINSQAGYFASQSNPTHIILRGEGVL